MEGERWEPATQVPGKPPCAAKPYSSPMSAVHPAPLPLHALLQRYQRNGAYADCYCIELPAPVSHEAFVAAFYTTPVFKLERLLLHWLLKKPSTDAEARTLAAGARDAFAAWTVEARAPDQLLMCDVAGRTRSWLMTERAAQGTRLFFGSAVVPRVDRATGRSQMGAGFHALLGFHKLYSRVLLRSAARRLPLEAVS